jgi:hypothetical protein
MARLFKAGLLWRNANEVKAGLELHRRHSPLQRLIS